MSAGNGLRVPSEAYARLRRLWDQHRADAFPAATTADPRIQEIALYESWLGGIAEAALGAGGRLSAAHRGMLEARQAERDPTLWSVAADMGEPVRSYVARLLAIEDLLRTLPEEG